MQSPSSIQQAKDIALSIRQHWFWHHGQRISLLASEWALYAISILLVLLNVYVISLGHRLLIAEMVDGPTRTSAYVEDGRITLVLTVGYVLLFLFSLSCFMLARVLRGMRKRRVLVQALCEVVAKL